MGKTKICIPEDQPASEQELEWIAELKQLHGNRLVVNGVSDADLLRFCRAYVNEDSPKVKTFETIASYLTWRETEKIDEIASTEYERYAEYVKQWPCGFSGLSKDQHPIYFDCIGQMSPSGFAKAFQPEEYVNIHLQMMENLQDIKVALSERLGRPVYKHVVVLDLNGFGMGHVWDRTALNKLVEIDSTKYPETLHKMLIINPPFMFKAIWAMFSGLLDDTTKSRIHILKKDADLLEHIDPSQLPKKYGGLIEYPADVPLFSLPFATAEGHTTEFDDIFADLLLKRQRRLAAKQALQDSMNTTTTTTTTGEETSTTTTTTTTDAPTDATTTEATTTEATTDVTTPAVVQEEETKQAENITPETVLVTDEPAVTTTTTPTQVSESNLTAEPEAVETQA